MASMSRCSAGPSLADRMVIIMRRAAPTLPLKRSERASSRSCGCRVEKTPCGAAETNRHCGGRTVSPANGSFVHDKILIVDFGSQVTQLIARRVRDEGVYCEIVPFSRAEAAFQQLNPRGII